MNPSKASISTSFSHPIPIQSEIVEVDAANLLLNIITSVCVMSFHILHPSSNNVSECFLSRRLCVVVQIHVKMFTFLFIIRIIQFSKLCFVTTAEKKIKQNPS